MPSSRFLIASNTLTSSAASVTFSSIPGTYTDLVLRVSARNNTAGTVYDAAYQIKFNGVSGGNSYTQLAGNGASASSNRATSTDIEIGRTPNSGATSNTFSNAEVYIPNYAGSTSKPTANFNVAENNNTTAKMQVTAGLVSSTSAITSLEIVSADTFVSGSSFFLYGISNT